MKEIKSLLGLLVACIGLTVLISCGAEEVMKKEKEKELPKFYPEITLAMESIASTAATAYVNFVGLGNVPIEKVLLEISESQSFDQKTTIELDTVGLGQELEGGWLQTEIRQRADGLTPTTLYYSRIAVQLMDTLVHSETQSFTTVSKGVFSPFAYSSRFQMMWPNPQVSFTDNGMGYVFRFNPIETLPVFLSEYDPILDVWTDTEIENEAFRRSFVTMANMIHIGVDGHHFLIFGITGSGTIQQFNSTVFEVFPETGEVVDFMTYPGSPISHAQATTFGDKVYVYGVTSVFGATDSLTLYEFDYKSKVWDQKDARAAFIRELYLPQVFGGQDIVVMAESFGQGFQNVYLYDTQVDSVFRFDGVLNLIPEGIVRNHHLIDDDLYYFSVAKEDRLVTNQYLNIYDYGRSENERVAELPMVEGSPADQIDASFYIDGTIYTISDGGEAFMIELDL